MEAFSPAARELTGRELALAESGDTFPLVGKARGPARLRLCRASLLRLLAASGLGVLLLSCRHFLKPAAAREGGVEGYVALAEKQGRVLTLARFVTNDALNGHYAERLGEAFAVNGQATYWSDYGFFVYWCPHQNVFKWLVGWRAAFADVKQRQICHYIAASAPMAAIGNASARANWAEWDNATQTMVERPKAGVEFYGSRVAQQLGSFTSLEKWPSCGEAFSSRVRIQTKSCNNCWAVSVAQVLEWRLCAKSPMKFQGPSAFISAGYLTSCVETSADRPHGGCGGGNPLKAMKWIAAHGVPTGGDGNNDWTCVPDFFDGINSLARKSKGIRDVPQCPQACTGRRYNRSLKEDLFRPEGWNESWATSAFESGAAAIRESGPIVIGFPVDEHFFSRYIPGTVYHYNETAHLFDHIAVAVGFGPDFVEAINSWGLGWGQLGIFRIHKDSVRTYVIPGELEGEGEGYPYPLPRRGASYLVVAGFRRLSMNARYTEVDWLEVNGNRVYLEASNSYFLYWCHAAHRYAIAGVKSLPEIRRGHICRYWALAPPGEEVEQLTHGWLELDEEQMHPIGDSGSGVVDSFLLEGSRPGLA